MNAGREHALETITPVEPVEGSPLIIDCSCGAEIECADDADAVERAFIAHVPGEWVIVRNQPHNLTGSRLVAATSKYREYARARLEEALYILDSGADIEILTAPELALMALAMECGSTEPITLDPEDIDDVMAREAGPACTCPPELRAHGGFRSTCPACGRWPGGG